MDKRIEAHARPAIAWHLPPFPLLVALLAYAIVLFTPAVLNDADTYWHVASGDWILDHRAVPLSDPFSFTVPGRTWVAHEWLAEVLMSLAYRAGGWSALVILFGVAAATTIGALAHYLARWMKQPAAMITLVLAAACVSPSLLARPHLLALPLLTLWTIGLLTATERKTAPPLYLLPLMTIWANLHGSFVLGLVLVPPLALDALLAARRDATPGNAWRDDAMRIVRGWSLFLVSAVAATLLTPHGWHGLFNPFQLMSLQHNASIGEWHPLNLLTLQPLEPALAALLYVVVTRRMRVPAVRMLMLLGLLYLAYRHSRHQMVAGIVGAALLAEPLGRAFGASAPSPAGRRAPLPGFVAVLVCAMLLAALRFAHPIVRGDGPVSPVTAVAAVPAPLLDQPVFNSYEFGGYLIFRHVKPFVDGRADMYGDAFMFAYIDALKPDRAVFDRLVAQYRIRWALLATGSAVAQMVATLPGWRRIHTDNIATVFVRDGP
ncbi:hypothetical protein [Burkholderia sp.]|uniref:hypothetical protein n=1 Tax=Burkholderia sp. TaxID=36773 RepID=UPI0025B8A2B0|nr:hypothetical protein [Burkholderia sp.]MBS6361062.1 hypothetical protein [Burkholderia sp.]